MVLKCPKCFILILITLVATTTFFVANSLIKKSQVFKIGAATGKADLFFVPDTLTLSSTSLPQTVALWVTTDNPLAFSRVTLTYNPSHLKMVAAPTASSSQISNVIAQSVLDSANQTGTYSFALGLLPTEKNNAPAGTFKLATFTLTPAQAQPNQATQLQIGSDIQLVDTGAVPFMLTTKSLALNLNPQAASPSPSSTPTPTPTTVASPSVTPSPSATPLPISDGIPPVLSVKSASSWFGGTTYTANASDASGVAQIQFYLNNKVTKTCNTTTSCAYTVSRRTNKTTLKVVATDKSTSANQTSLQYPF